MWWADQAYVEGGDGAGGVAADELHLDAELAVEVLVLGVEAGAAGAAVHDERDLLGLAVFFHLHVAAGSDQVELVGEPGLRHGGDDA